MRFITVHLLVLAGVSSSFLASPPLSSYSLHTCRRQRPFNMGAESDNDNGLGLDLDGDNADISTKQRLSSSPSFKRSLSKSLLCIRHGVSVANELMDRPGNRWGDPTFRDDPTLIDAPLSTSGRRLTQQQLQHQLRSDQDIQQFLKDIELIIISPLTRCLQTFQVGVEPILSELGLVMTNSRVDCCSKKKEDVNHDDVSHDVPVIALPLLRERVYTASDTGRDISTLQEEFPTVNFDECCWYDLTGNDDDTTNCTSDKDVQKQQQPWWYHHPTHTDDGSSTTYVEWRPYGQGQWYAVPGEPEDVFDRRMEKFDEWLSNRPERNVLIVAHWGVLRHMSGGTEWKNAEAKLVQWQYCRQSKKRTTFVSDPFNTAISASTASTESVASS